MSKRQSNPHDAYIDQCNHVSNAFWARRVISTVDHLRLANVRLNFDASVNNSAILKTRLYDQYVQSWNTSLNNCKELTYYCRFNKRAMMALYHSNG